MRIRLFSVSFIMCIMLVGCASTRHTETSETVVRERITDNSFTTSGQATIKPIYADGAVDLKPFFKQNYVSEFATSIEKTTKNGKKKRDSIEVQYNHHTNEFKVKYIATLDTLRDTTTKISKVVELPKDKPNWYIVLFVIIVALFFVAKSGILNDKK